jgi:glucose/arabinose dehydrogenase
MNSFRPKSAPFFGVSDIVVSAPFQRYGVSDQTRIPGVVNSPGGVPKFNAGIFSVPLTGGEINVEAHGVRYARGLAFEPQFGRLYFTNDGMEFRGSRPVKDDPDAVLQLVNGTWYGWPDFSADLLPIDRDALRRTGGYDPDRFQPPLEKVQMTGYPDVSYTINHPASFLVAPARNTLLSGVFPSQSGAAGIDFVPTTGPGAEAFKAYAGSAVVALSGDRAPFATGGTKVGPIGYKVMRVDVYGNQVRDFIRNTQGKPRSLLNENDRDLVERPIQARFGPDGALYVLDFGRMEMKGGREDVKGQTGGVYRLKAAPADAVPTAAPAAAPATEPAAP